MSFHKDFTLAMLGPVEIAQYLDLLDESMLPEIIPKGLGGSPVNLLCRELISRGWQLLIVTVSPDVQDEVILEGKNLKICVGPYTNKRARNLFSRERAYMLKVLLREKPTIVHAHWTYEFAMVVQASGLPHVITAHDAPISVLRLNFIPYRIVRTLMAYRVLSRAKRVVSVSPYVAKHLKRFMFYRGDGEVIPNGVPDYLFKCLNVDSPKHRPLTFATILNGWAGYKNGQVAIEAFARIRLECQDVRLIMFGHGHGPGESAENWAKKMGITDGVEFIGYKPYKKLMDMVAQEVDVLVHPSLEEAQSMVMTEVMAMGLPIIGGKYSGGVPWTLNQGRAGILVDVANTNEVASAMLRLANNPEERQKLGQLGREFAESKFHIRIVADAYERVYQDLIAY